MKSFPVMGWLAVVGRVCMATGFAATGPVDWNWSFDQTVFVVGQKDRIVIRGTIFNPAGSSGPLQPSGVGLNFTGDMQKTYSFAVGSPLVDFARQFRGLSLEPGASFPFVFGTLTPIGGEAPVGRYPSDLAFLEIGGATRFPGNSFEVRVVPEPGVAWLAVLGAAGLARVRRHPKATN